MLTDGLEWCGYYRDVFISWHPFTAEHPLVSNDWMLDLSKSDEETKSSILDGLRIDFQQILISGWTIPLKLSIR